MEHAEWLIPDNVDAPITLALAQSLKEIHDNVAAAPAHQRTDAALNGLYALASDVLTAIYKLETGRGTDVRLVSNGHD